MANPELSIDDVIGGGFFFGGITARQVNRFLKENDKAKEITVRINSPGGDVFEGMAIHNALKRSGARVIVEVEGLAASAASIVAMAGDEIRVSKGAMIMIHESRSGLLGTADDHEAAAANLRKINVEAADIYAARSGQDQAKCLDMMADETWMGADEAKSLGFCTDVIAAKGKAEKPKSKAAAQMLASYRHAPSLMAAWMQAIESKEGSDNPEAEETDMNEEQILKALGVQSVAEASARLAVLQRIEARAGKTGDEAHGTIMAAMDALVELPKAQARIAELEAANEAHALDALMLKAKEDKKLTPAIEASVREAYAAKQVTLKGAEAWLANLTAVPALMNASKAPAQSPVGPDAKWNGKAYADLKPAERAELKREQPELYEAMKASHN